MNAQISPAATSPSPRVGTDSRSSPEAADFQAVFASAAQEMPKGELTREVPSAPGRDSEDAESTVETVARKRSPEDAGGVLNALAAGLVMPLPTANPCSASAPIARSGEESALVCAVESSEPANSPLLGNFEIGAAALSVATPRAAADAATVLGEPNISSAAELIESSAPAPGDDTAQAALPDRRPLPIAEVSKQAGNFLPPVVKNAARAETQTAPAASAGRHNASDSANEETRTAARGMADGGARTEAPRASWENVVDTTPTVIDESHALVDQAAQMSSAGSTPSGPTAGKNKIGRSAEAQVAAAEAASSAAAVPRSTAVAEPMAAERPARERRGSASGKPEQGAPVRDGFSGIAQSTSSAEAVTSSANQVVAGPAAHSSSPSPPIPTEHSGVLDLSRADAAPVPATPVLQTTQLLQRMDKAEIRIGLQSADFGAIRLHTTVANDQVGAAVSTSHPGLHDALLAEAPSLEKAIARHSLRLDSVSVDAGSANSNFNSFGSNEQKQPRAEPLYMPAVPAARSQSAHSVTPGAPAREADYRLDVRA